MEQKPPERYRSSAREAFIEYGCGAVFFFFIEIFCIRDGWFRPDYEHIPFNRGASYVCGPIFIFCTIMAISAGLTLRREKKQGPPPSASEPPPAP